MNRKEISCSIFITAIQYYKLFFGFFHNGKNLNYISRQYKNWGKGKPSEIENLIAENIGIVRTAADHQQKTNKN